MFYYSLFSIHIANIGHEEIGKGQNIVTFTTHTLRLDISGTFQKQTNARVVPYKIICSAFISKLATLSGYH